MKRHLSTQTRKRILSSLGLILFSVSFVLAQVLVKGTVKDNLGEGVPGASVQVKGTSQGTITDLDGKFAFSVPNKNAIIVISFIGYVTVEQKVDTQKPMVITLREDTKTLDEVVVVGYQEVRKRDLTGSVAKANMNDVLTAPVASFDQALGGRIAGVNVTSGEGMPGGTMNIVIRGNNSLTQENSPLFVIDGFPVEDTSASSTLNPSDIESIDFLKDASATAIYGARGANGVVIVTTKKGKVGRAQLTYDGSFGVQHITRTIPMMNAYEFVKLQNEMYPTVVAGSYLMNYEGKQWTLEDYRNIDQYNWQDEIFQTAWQQSHTLRLTGGTEGVRYNASLSYYDQDGTLLETGYKRMQGRMNTVVRRGKLNMSLTTNYSRSIQTGSTPSATSYSGMNNLFYSVWGYRPVTSPDTPLSFLMDSATDNAVDSSNDYRFNPILSLKNEYRKNYINNLQMNGFAEYEVINGLKVKVSAGYTYDARKNDQFNNSKTRYGGPTSTDKVNAQVTRSERLTWLNENTVTYQTNIKKKHFINALAGITFQNSDYEAYAFRTTHIPNESLGMAGMSEGQASTSSSVKSSWSMLSYLGRINYNYKSKYYATASFRVDGSSKFNKNNRFGYFPSASLAWTFTEEEFMKPIKSILSNGKLRFSWGLTGNNRIGEYDYYQLLSVLKSRIGSYTATNSIPSGVYPFENDATNAGTVPISLQNKNLKWETTEQWNLGVDLSFFDERIGLTMDIYRKNTRDLLLAAQLPYSSGFYNATKNIGKVRNDGLEISLNTLNIKTRDFQWSSNFNISFNKNKVLALSENQTALMTAVQFDQNYNGQSSYIAKIGLPMGLMYGYVYEGTYKYDDFNKSGNSYSLKSSVPHFSTENNTQPGMPKYADLNGDGVVDSNDRTIIGRGLPVHTGGLTNDFTYKGIDLSIFFQWSYGNDIMNANRLFFESSNNRSRELNQYASYTNRWTADNPTSDIPAATNSSSNRVISSRIIEDGSFLRLKNVTIGYTFPSQMTKKWKIDKARIYVAAQNLWTWTGYSGYDPEVSVRNSALTPGLDYSSYPRAYSVSFGVSLGF
ncbi:SusC/RagA family TonB-linked outer membrane protein [Bacteroides acidifaciens]|jgi:TonB-linked outer membrane protein, SusC/RagA family/TonB-dependent outer membrane receptor, SusC/RagA subfamily, signature region|uniref:SusC/RagA family TonB-linked outer membrane protein n=1 Tax=Bacteroides acidifaciens TaxID=85831 RepID=UPI00138EE141|nr:TonB-dependent receptor [Bacteroides acidifaciens]MCR1996396.1 TonB-dependent receptor [Bacteroides acidifaciens]